MIVFSSAVPNFVTSEGIAMSITQHMMSNIKIFISTDHHYP